MAVRVPVGRRVALVIVSAVAAIGFAAPSAVLAHALSNTYQSRLPLIVYLAGAAIAGRDRRGREAAPATIGCQTATSSATSD